MTGAELLDFLKTSTSTENFNIDDTQYYKWLTTSHKKVSEMVKSRVDSKFFMRIYYADLVIGQNIYDQLPVNVIDSVYMKYELDGKFKKADIKDISELANDPTDYKTSQSFSDPFYMISESKVFMYPVATNDVPQGLKFIGKSKVGDISATTTEAEVFNGTLTEYDDMVAEYAKRFVYQHTQEFNKKNDARAEFKTLFADMISEISFRGSQPQEYEEPDLSALAGGETTAIFD